ncbi:response regulator [Flavobacterium sp. F-328]|jgi:CheY-like chemotaxis protein|uniref:Response regulator n=1 Tax=Flavobacterium erciyesense TaxID=2825842 RepID=A0ABS5D276_9FLAO|nr:response regulator [Flavobacterium erciyesense]MBQ0908119.1 response regulator [Flavobacterium erciyesense]
MKNKLTYIIDDDKLTARLMTILITKNNFCEKIESFPNAQSAIDVLRENVRNQAELPDAILLDLNMPMMDGWQFLDEFMLLPFLKDIHVFIMTSSIDPVDIEKAKKYAVVKYYIDKPITIQKLQYMQQIIEGTN